MCRLRLLTPRHAVGGSQGCLEPQVHRIAGWHCHGDASSLMAHLWLQESRCVAPTQRMNHAVVRPAPVQQRPPENQPTLRLLPSRRTEGPGLCPTVAYFSVGGLDLGIHIKSRRTFLPSRSSGRLSILSNPPMWSHWGFIWASPFRLSS